MNKKTKLKLISWNVNGLRACLGKNLKGFLEQERPDIIGLQEIKIDEKSLAKKTFDFPNYQEYWHPAKRPGYSGTGILARDGLGPLKVVFGLGNSVFDDEGRVITMEMEDFYFVTAYFPNANHELSRLSYKEKFNQTFLKYILRLNQKKPVVMCGDFNVAHQDIDLKNPNENRGSAGFTEEERASMSKFLAAGFIDTFRFFYPHKIQYSWWSYRFLARQKGIGWRIDYFLASDRIVEYIRDAFILDQVTGSDHAPVGIIIAK